jgi:AsmA-like C-terminal region/AsmA family
MKKLVDKIRSFFSSKAVKKVFKIILYSILGLILLILVSAIGLRIYFEKNKTEIVAKINTQINENINGEARIGDIGYKFLIGFPNFTVVLKEVELKDSLITIHKRPVLKAGEIEVRLNVLKLLKKEVNIRKIVIIDAKIDLFVDKNGVSNSNIFKPKNPKTKKANNTTTINEVYLKNVNFISENQQGNKLFHFDVKSLKCKILYTDQGWKTDVRLNTFAKSLAFNSLKGSFVKDKAISGDLIVNFSQERNNIGVVTQDFTIGEDDFKIKANFNVGKGNSLFDIDIRTQIKWGNASSLLANNISSKLNKFALNEPLLATCAIKGDMRVKGDPEIVVTAEVKDDELTTLQGVVKKCSFHGKFTNNYRNGLGCNDANSAIIITDFSGIYKEIPVSIPSAIINNLEKPLATGKLNTNFELPKLGGFVDEDFITFAGGKVIVNFDFKVDIVDVKLHKPKFTGAIIVKKGTFSVKTKNMHFQNTDIELYFSEDALVIKKIKFQNKLSTVFMEGRVDNFLNLYYDDPEKLNLNWKIYSPYIDLKQIVGVLTYHHKGKQPPVSTGKKPSYDLHEVLRKAQATLEIKVDKLTYKKMIADDFKVKVVLAKKGLFVNNVSIQGSTGSTLQFDAQVIPQGKTVLFKTNIQLANGNVSQFLASFDNFGVKSFTPNDVKGNLTLKTSLSGFLNQERELMPNTINGNLAFTIKDGALSNFEPIQKIGKIAFPYRDVKNITFSDLAATASIKGNLIHLKDLKITSNILNIDAKGTYSLANRGTNLAVKIPLRNPKDDYKITDLKARDATRYKGIVINLVVVDGKDGKASIKLGKPSGDKSVAEPPNKSKVK